MSLAPAHPESAHREEDVPVLEAIEVTKRFGGVVALDGVSVAFPRRTVTAIVGDNGAGKSTLLKIFAGAHTTYDGSIRVEGETTHFRSPLDARANGIETVYQDLALAPDLDVVANLFLGRELTSSVGVGRLFRFMRQKAMRAEASQAMAALGVAIPSLAVEAKSLSGGQRQGIAIARAAQWSSRLVILDEPTAALGVQETEKVEEMIRNLAERGLTIILVTHRLDQVFRLADRVAVLRRGRLVGVRRTSETNGDDVVKMITGLAELSHDAWA
jgi:ABC-type sugar transport system ATPase subunit